MEKRDTGKGMRELIEALQIFAKYDPPLWPTHCEHDVLYVLVDPGQVSDEDKKRLDELGFIPCRGDIAGFMSFRFGPA